MERSRLDRLLELATHEEQIQLKVLYNSSLRMLKAYENEPTSAKLRDMDNGRAALEKYANNLEEKYLQRAKIFDNILSIFPYLRDEGWQISQSGLYKHKKEGKLAPEPDGTYRQESVDEYARAWLKRKSTGEKERSPIDELQRQKLEEELEKLKTENSRSKLKLEVEQGKYIERDAMYMELAARAGIFDAGLNYWIQTGAAEWTRLVGGDMKKVGELINAMTAGKDDLLNEYAKDREFTVIFDSEDEESEDER